MVIVDSHSFTSTYLQIYSKLKYLSQTSIGKISNIFNINGRPLLAAKDKKNILISKDRLEVKISAYLKQEQEKYNQEW